MDGIKVALINAAIDLDDHAYEVESAFGNLNECSELFHEKFESIVKKFGIEDVKSAISEIKAEDVNELSADKILSDSSLRVFKADLNWGLEVFLARLPS